MRSHPPYIECRIAKSRDSESDLDYEEAISEKIHWIGRDRIHSFQTRIASVVTLCHHSSESQELSLLRFFTRVIEGTDAFA